MGDVSPFANYFVAASPDEEAASSHTGSSESAGHSPVRVVGFTRSPSSAEGLELPRAPSIAAERTSSLGQALREQQRRQAAEQQRPRLSIQTTRSCRLSARVKLVPRIQEDAELGQGGAAAEGSCGFSAFGAAAAAGPNLGTTLPGRAPLTGLSRACSGNIDMPARMAKAQTAPEPLPESLVMAAITAGYPGLSPSAGGGRSPAAAANGAGALHGRQPLQAQPPQAQTSDSSGSTNSGSSRPPMPVTPAFAAASKATPQRQGSTYKDLFDAQAETSMAQAQLAGLHEALRREHDEVARLRLELELAIAERNLLRDAVGPRPDAPVHTATYAGHGLGHGHGQPSHHAAPCMPQGAGQLSRLAGRAGLRRQGPAPGAQRQMAQPAAPPPPPADAQAAAPTMVSAFANALPFSFD